MDCPKTSKPPKNMGPDSDPVGIKHLVGVKAEAWDAAVVWGVVRTKPRSTPRIAPMSEDSFPLGRCGTMYSCHE